MTESVLIRFSDDSYGMPVGEDNEFASDEVMRDIHAAMDFDDLLAIDFSYIKKVDGAFDILSHRVAKNEKNILAHIMRIRIAYRENRPKPLYAALSDLFLALDEHGREIKLRMLEGAKSRLVRQDYEMLLTHIYGDADQIHYSHYSILGKGLFEGIKALVRKIEVVHATAIEHDFMAEANGYIEYGQLGEAKSCLEAAIQNGSSDHEVHELLIDLFVKTKDKKGFSAMLDSVGKMGGEGCSALWGEAKRWFE